jgi:histidine kinase
MMKAIDNLLRKRIVSKLIITVGLTLLCSISIWAYFNIKYQKQKLMQEVVVATDRLTTTIKLGTHYAMMLNSRDDITQIITNVGRQEQIKNVRIYNKQGQIKFSNEPAEVDTRTNIKAEACYICHRSEPPLVSLSLNERTRIFESADGYRLLGVISPIRNEPGCSTDSCHVHPQNKQILGALDVVVSLAETDAEILNAEKGIIALALAVFLLTSAIILVIVLRFVNRPVRELIAGTRRIAKGVYSEKARVDQHDEMGQLADAINQMGREIGIKQAELNKQRDEYQTLFERAPCMITMQDRNYKLLRYNQAFVERFGPEVGEYCYQAYKGRNEKCANCPVEKTFLDGKPHYGEERGVNNDGTAAYFIFQTSPLLDENGQIVAAMEMSLDITERRQLEKDLELSEKKYHGIFNNIPNPVFVLDRDSLAIIDCNDSVRTIYGYDRQEIVGHSFMELFRVDERQRYTPKLTTAAVINQVKHLTQAGRTIFVNIRISPFDTPGRNMLLVTTSDITKRLETEQQLIQASKMATLGEMATGIAHELNQPLSVIKTASSFCMKKINNAERIGEDVLTNMLTKIDSNVDRAAKIINHMREFARKSDAKLTKVHINQVLENAFEIFSQQLKVRGIQVVWDIQPDLPPILGDASRLEQVFINLLINARDAIEDRWTGTGESEGDKRITLKSRREKDKLVVEVCDTGMGIPEEIAEKIFEPFFTTKEVGKGTGLGLSISYGIVQECKGTIRADAQPQGGACFILTFPVPASTEAEGPTA